MAGQPVRSGLYRPPVTIESVREEFESILKEIEGKQAKVLWHEENRPIVPRPERAGGSPALSASKGKVMSASETLDMLNQKYGAASPRSESGTPVLVRRSLDSNPDPTVRSTQRLTAAEQDSDSVRLSMTSSISIMSETASVRASNAAATGGGGDGSGGAAVVQLADMDRTPASKAPSPASSLSDASGLECLCFP
jgi:hypothetical protein